MRGGEGQEGFLGEALCPTSSGEDWERAGWVRGPEQDQGHWQLKEVPVQDGSLRLGESLGRLPEVSRVERACVPESRGPSSERSPDAAREETGSPGPQPRSRHAPRPMRRLGGGTWPGAFKGLQEHVGVWGFEGHVGGGVSTRDPSGRWSPR